MTTHNSTLFNGYTQILIDGIEFHILTKLVQNPQILTYGDSCDYPYPPNTHRITYSEAITLLKSNVLSELHPTIVIPDYVLSWIDTGDAIVYNAIDKTWYIQSDVCGLGIKAPCILVKNA